VTDVPLKHLCSLPPEYGLNITPDRYRDEGVRLLRTSDIIAGGGVRDSRGVFLDAEDVPTEMLLRDGDLLFSRSGTLGRALLYSHDQHGEATFAGFLVRFRLRRSIDPRAIRYWSESAPFVGTVASEAIQSTISNFNADRYANLAVPRWLVEHSAVVADYLDAETAHIDQIVECLAQANLLLDEWIAAEIEATIWSGGEPLVPLMHLTPGDRQIQYGIVLPGPDVPDGVPIVKGGNIVTGRLQAGGLARTTEEIEAGFARSRLRRNDIVFAIRGAVGACAMVPEEVEGSNITQDVARVSPLPGVDPSWLLYALKSRTLQQQVESRIVGATIRGVNIRDLKRVRVPVPTSSGQRRKAEALGQAHAHRDQVYARRQRQIDLLMERRQALTTAAVTGQLEIPGVAA
jgi:type I restriction enzyme S subunit